MYLLYIVNQNKRIEESKLVIANKENELQQKQEEIMARNENTNNVGNENGSSANNMIIY